MKKLQDVYNELEKVSRPSSTDGHTVENEKLNESAKSELVFPKLVDFYNKLLHFQFHFLGVGSSNARECLHAEELLLKIKNGDDSVLKAVETDPSEVSHAYLSYDLYSRLKTIASFDDVRELVSARVDELSTAKSEESATSHRRLKIALERLDAIASGNDEMEKDVDWFQHGGDVEVAQKACYVLYWTLAFLVMYTDIIPLMHVHLVEMMKEFADQNEAYLRRSLEVSLEVKKEMETID